MNYDNTNSGILTANTRQRDGKQDPTHQGSINIDGKEYWLSAWVNTGKEGGKLAGQRYFSIKARPKDQPQNQGFDMKAAEQKELAKGSTRDAVLAGEFDDDIPF